MENPWCRFFSHNHYIHFPFNYCLGSILVTYIKQIAGQTKNGISRLSQFGYTPVFCLVRSQSVSLLLIFMHRTCES